MCACVCAGVRTMLCAFALPCASVVGSVGAAMSGRMLGRRLQHLGSPLFLFAAVAILVFTCARAGAIVSEARGVCIAVVPGVLSIAAAVGVMMRGLMFGWCRALLAAWLAVSPDGIAIFISRGSHGGHRRWHS